MAPSRGLTGILHGHRLHRLRRTTAPSRDLTRILGSHRPFTSLGPLQSGHNRWSKIKHDKGKNDAIKNRQRSAFAQEIATASKLSGPDPANNPRLADAIAKAKKEGFAKASIESAIARGQGKSSSGATLEPLTIEAILPHNVAVIVECETDSRLRTLADVRTCMKGAGGSATPCAYLFEKQGRVVFESKEGVGVEEALESALEAGAIDVNETEDDGSLVVTCEPSDTAAVGEAVGSALGLAIQTSDIVYTPRGDTTIELPGDDVANELGDFIDQLLDREATVRAISMNISQGTASTEAWRDLQSRLTT